MKSVFINPFIDATVTTFDTMCGLKALRNGNLTLEQGVFDTFDLLSIVGLSGKVRGAVLLTMPEEVGLSAVSAFLGEELSEVNAELLDALGELVNIIAGAAAAKLEDYEIKLSLPTVLVGRNQAMSGNEQVPWVVIPMRFPEHGEFSIEVSMEEV